MTAVKIHGALMGWQLAMIVFDIATGVWFIAPVSLFFICLSAFMINMALRTME